MSDRGSLLYCRFLGVVDLLGHTLGLDCFGWFGRVCDAYDDTARRYWDGR